MEVLNVQKYTAFITLFPGGIRGEEVYNTDKAIECDNVTR